MKSDIIRQALLLINVEVVPTATLLHLIPKEKKNIGGIVHNKIKKGVE